MKVFYNLKTRDKLLVLVVVMLIGITVIGSIGFYFNSRSQKACDDMYNDTVTSIVQLSDIRTQSRANFANILNLMVSTTQDQRTKVLENYDKRFKTITDEIAAFKAIMSQGYETTQMKVIETNLEKWDTLSKEMIDLINAGKEPEAAAEFKDKGEAVFEDLQTSIRDMVNYNVDDAKTVYTTNSKEHQTASFITIGFSGLILLISAVLGFLITRSITGPVKRIVSLIKKSADFDFAYDRSYEDLLLHKDEMGTIANSLAVMRVEFRRIIGAVRDTSDTLAASSEELAVSTAETRKTLAQIVSAVNEIAEGNSSQAGMLSRTSQAVSGVTHNIEDVKQAGISNSEGAKHSMKLIEEGQRALDLTTHKMEENVKVSNDVDRAVDELSAQMNKVGEIVGVIRQISEQTNRLALNAAIEAARAGIAGRGFAVVASEIGKLAEDTNHAVDEIGGIVGAAIEKNQMTSEKMDKVREIVSDQEKSIDVTKNSFVDIRSAVKEIAERTMDISAKITDISRESEKIADQTQDIAAVSQETAASSQEISAGNEEQLSVMGSISDAANDLSAMATSLNLEVAKFKI